MTIELLHSNLDKSDALGLLTNILYATINYHEHKIILNDSRIRNM